MSRRRSTNPTKAISITLPQDLLTRLDNHLGYNQSRSAFIASTLQAKLNDYDAFSLHDLSSSQIRAHLWTRSDTSAALRIALNAEEVNSSSSDLAVDP